MNYIERNWLVSLYLKDARWRLLDTFDAITPAIASTHTTEEVSQWLLHSHCRDVHVTPWCSTSLTGRRASVSRAVDPFSDNAAAPLAASQVAA
jgi:hypothetical protein